ncbi:Bifunctional adenosylcobalamin biosynthesis protein CobU [Rubrobacter xylanophilus DSM 9941]|uniref:bifunctional adenosylcobinamide kinase/adenosylcobinamide-phosphate guanylyltransferase n=1 Tax=Rubrobacter xylanophilus TaxID=49319 RepID=UPI001C64304C|nr:bifunctional adenosylcobinamide kinase/adenosylcobinamide-phosphate guanylyltransferase [Rubrobacter xylanophilus]QYJ16852.1 Bifunctional adenosylcobalamin biosynthesis protein CobU [Rubrobacter xylanophilus DSM 9941]
MSWELVFVTGGARSGKSRHAETLAAGLGDRVLYVATAEAADDEMRRRIEEHQRRRPHSWETLEARRSVGKRLRALDGAPEVVLLDCLSLLVSNALLDEAARRGEGPGLEDAAARAVGEELSDLLNWYGEAGRHLVVVSNEVGWGVVPPSRLGRIYRDLLGNANQQIAARADRVVLMVAGLPLEVKRP